MDDTVNLFRFPLIFIVLLLYFTAFDNFFKRILLNKRLRVKLDHYNWR